MTLREKLDALDAAIKADVDDPSDWMLMDVAKDAAYDLAPTLSAIARAASAINAHFPPSGVTYINAAFDADIKRLRAALDAAEGGG